MPDPSPSNADSLKLQLLTARKKEWWSATADSYLSTVIHITLAGIEPTTFHLPSLPIVSPTRYQYGL